MGAKMRSLLSIILRGKQVSKVIEKILAIGWAIAANVIIFLGDGDLTLFRKIFNYLEKKQYKSSVTINQDGEFVSAIPNQELFWRALCVTYVRYVCIKIPLVGEYLSKN
ncbi:MAG: hypothetical protein RLZZ139_1315 [Cyanobacteriota bacterium]|jgi:hypothetical protein